MLVARCGLTFGGSNGQEGIDTSIAEAAEHVQELLEAARGENPEIIVLAQGGPISTPADTDELYRLCDAQGVVGESAIERIPIERYVSAEIHNLKTQELRASARALA